MVNMAGKTICIAMLAIVVTLFTTMVVSNDFDPIPSDRTQVDAWFQKNVQDFRSRPNLDPELVNAERNPIRISVNPTSNFKTVQQAINSIPQNNTQRYIVAISGGTYFEKIKVTQKFVTLLGSRNSKPILVFNDNARKVGSTVGTATVAAYGDYFVASNIIFKNSAPRPDPATRDGQALAFGAFGNKAALYNCEFYGFQDTICDDHAGANSYKHYYMDCYVEGTVDFIWGHGKALFVRTSLNVLPGNSVNAIAANYREALSLDSGFSFVQCTVSGQAHARNTYLARTLKPFATVIFSYTNISDVIISEGWKATASLTPGSNQSQAIEATHAFYREYKNNGAGAAPPGKPRGGPSAELGDLKARRFISLAYIEGSKWLLPPP